MDIQCILKDFYLYVELKIKGRVKRPPIPWISPHPKGPSHPHSPSCCRHTYCANRASSTWSISEVDPIIAFHQVPVSPAVSHKPNPMMVEVLTYNHKRENFGQRQIATTSERQPNHHGTGPPKDSSGACARSWPAL